MQTPGELLWAFRLRFVFSSFAKNAIPFNYYSDKQHCLELLFRRITCFCAQQGNGHKNNNGKYIPNA